MADFRSVPFRSILFRSVPFRSVPICSIHFRSVPISSILFCSVLFCSVLFCSVLFCFVLFCSILLFSVLFSSVLFCCVLFTRVDGGVSRAMSSFDARTACRNGRKRGSRTTQTQLPPWVRFWNWTVHIGPLIVFFDRMWPIQLYRVLMWTFCYHIRSEFIQIGLKTRIRLVSFHTL